MKLLKIAVTLTAAVAAAGALIGVYAAMQRAAPGEQRQPVAGDDPVAVPDPSEKALRYYRSGNAIWAGSVLWGLAVPAALLITGFSARMRDLAMRIGRRRWYFSLVAYLAVFTLVTFLIDLPLSYYTSYLRPHAYGLSNQELGKWIGDAFKGLGITLVMAALFGWIPFLLLKKSPRRWWFYSGLLAVPIIILMLLVSPVVIAPMFNDFGPMKDKELEAKILHLAERAGISGGRVFEVNKSTETKMVNAYVTGFMGSKRIVLWDTIIEKLDEEELLYVMGHEMGHYVLGHVTMFIVFGSGLVMFGLWVVHRSAGTLLRRFDRRFGFNELSDFASLPLITLLFSLVTFALSPAVLAMSRHNEKEADRFGAEVTQLNRAGATAFVKLADQNLGIPRPGWMYKLWRSSHPPIGERIDFLNTYMPWKNDGSLRYQRHFTETPTERLRPQVEVED
jgi:STE24 endopeptidase